MKKIIQDKKKIERNEAAVTFEQQKEIRQQFIRIFGKREFQADGKASAKALSQEAAGQV